MSVPKHLWRFPTRAAIDRLAERFRLPNTRDMQDWEWEVADPARIDEFLAAYGGGELTEDEQFVLMEMLLQSFEELDAPLVDDPRWSKMLDLLVENIELHAHSIWYWSDLNDDGPKSSWRVTPYMREIMTRHEDRFENRVRPQGG